jgi:hypothetical protein
LSIALEWTQIEGWKYHACDGDGLILYRIIRSQGLWRARMNNELIGGQFMSLAQAIYYVEWGGSPNRMGYDPLTGEVCDPANTPLETD